jgi:hypothetical protein
MLRLVFMCQATWQHLNQRNFFWFAWSKKIWWKIMSPHRPGLRRVEKIPEFGPAHFITTGSEQNEFHVSEEVKKTLDNECRFIWNYIQSFINRSKNLNVTQVKIIFSYSIGSQSYQTLISLFFRFSLLSLSVCRIRKYCLYFEMAKLSSKNRKNLRFLKKKVW